MPKWLIPGLIGVVVGLYVVPKISIIARNLPGK